MSLLTVISAGGLGRVSDIPQLDSVSEGDITLPSSPAAAAAVAVTAAVTAAVASSDDGGGDSTAANHSRMTSEASAPPPDYENVISVSVHRAGPGVRAWRTYSDVGDSAHDYSVVTERAGRGRLDESAVTEVTESADGGSAAPRHTYENTDNVALMIAHLEEEEEERGDASLLVATIDTVERSAVSALFSSPPRRSRSSDDLAVSSTAAAAAAAATAARRRPLNTSFDPGLLVAPPSGDVANYKCPRSPPEAIYARPTKRANASRGGRTELREPGAEATGVVGRLSQDATRPNPQQRETAKVQPLPAGSTGVRQARAPLSPATVNSPATPAAASPRRKFSVLRSRFELAGRRYAVTPAGSGVSRRPSLQAAARALWTSRGRRPGKENDPPPPALSPIDL